MAVRVPKSCFSDSDWKEIKKEMLITTETKIFGCYIENKETYSLPFDYGSCLLGDKIPDFSKCEDREIEYNGKELREYQKKDLIEILDFIKNDRVCFLHLFTGYGKTLMASYLTSYLKKLTLIMMNMSPLVKQWKKSIEENTDARVWMVGEEKMPDEFDVIICMALRAKDIPEDIRDKVGLLIVDEAHTFCVPSMIGPVLSFHPEYLILESASDTRLDEAQSILELLVGDNKIIRHNPKPFDVHIVDTGIKGIREKKRVKGRDSIDYPLLERSIIFNDERNALIVKLVLSTIGDKKGLILTSRVEHCTDLLKLFKNEGVQVDYCAGKKSKVKDSKLLIGNMKKIGTGWDQASACEDFDGQTIEVGYIVGHVKFSEKIKQNVGRVLRGDKPVIYHLRDNDSVLQRQVGECVKWYKSQNTTIHKMNMM